MAIMTTSNNKWKLSQTISASGTITKTLETAGSLVDKNIDIEINVPEAQFQTTGGTTEDVSSGWVEAGSLSGAGTISDA